MLITVLLTECLLYDKHKELISMVPVGLAAHTMLMLSRRKYITKEDSLIFIES